MPTDFYKETLKAFGHTTPHFQKSQKTCVANKDLHNSFSVFPSFFFFATAHDGKDNAQKNKSYARTHRGTRLKHDGATSHTARMTVNLLKANKDNYLAIQIIDLLKSTISVPYLGHYQLCRKETGPCFSNLQDMGIAQRQWYLYAVRGFDA